MGCCVLRGCDSMRLCLFLMAWLLVLCNEVVVIFLGKQFLVSFEASFFLFWCGRFFEIETVY